MSTPNFRSHLERLWFFFREGSTSSGVLKDLINEVESTSGYARNDVRAKAKSWLISHRRSLVAKDILLAETHFGYLLPKDWNA